MNNDKNNQRSFDILTPLMSLDLNFKNQKFNTIVIYLISLRLYIIFFQLQYFNEQIP